MLDVFDDDASLYSTMSPTFCAVKIVEWKGEFEFSRSRESARAVGLRARIECDSRAQCGRFLRSRRNLTSFSLPLSLGRCFVSVRAEKNRARARAPERIERRRRERVSQIFLARAHRSSRPRDTRARRRRRRRARGLQQISKGERWGRSRRNVSHVRSRKKSKCESRVERTFLLSSFDRSKLVSRGFLQNGIAREFSVSSENETSRKYSYTTRGWCLSAPHQICADVVVSFFCVCVLVGFFCLVFRGVDACWPSKQENLPFFGVMSLSPPPKRRFFFFCGI